MSNFDILKSALAGKRLAQVLIVDCHGHLDFWKPAFRFSPTSAEGMLATMDRIGIDVLCINKWNCPDVEEANRDVAKVIRQYPDRFVGFATTGPSLGKEFNLTQLKRAFEEWGFRGIKVHTGYDAHLLRDQTALPEYGETMESIWRFAAEQRCPVLCHGFLTPEIARRYPQARFIAAHAGGERQYAHRYRECPNVYFDTANSLTGRGNIEYFVQKVGAERILYGSDMPYANPAFRLGQVLATRVGDPAMRKILGENMAKILGIEKRSRGSR